jgi:endogenous inhibitor of DNA gyrase (YacG/DUF329 family)
VTPSDVLSRNVSCPRCGTRVEWTEKSLYRPFCSERCRIIDLGAWVTQAYRVPAEAADDADDSNA